MLIYAQKFGSKAAVLLALGWFGIAAYAQNSCSFTADEASILRTISFRTSSGAQPDFCRAGTVARKVLDGLVFIKARHWGASGADAFDRGLIPGEPFQFLIPRVRSIIFDSATSELCGPAVGARNMEHSGAINICPAIIGISTFEVATVLMHEARHSDGDGFLHVDCGAGRFNVAGGSCDESYESGGAYSVGTEFAVKISRDTSVSDDVRNFARGFAIQAFYERFVKKPIGIRPMVALESADGNVTMYDGTSAFGYGIKLNPAALTLTVKDHKLKIFDSLRGTSTDILNAGTYIPPADPLTKYFANKVSANERPRIVDFSIGPNYSCILFPESLRCIDGAGNVIQDLSFAGFKGKGFVDVAQSSTDTEGILYIAGDDGATHGLPGSARALANLRPGVLERNGVPSRLLNLAILGDSQIALMNDGTVSRYSTAARTWSKIPGFDQARFIKVLGTVNWSERIQQFQDESKPSVVAGGT